jgi:lipopolysaccharide export system ATP-binding protein
MLFAEHLSRHYTDRLAVEDVTLYVKPGETVALLGPSGAGKTTIFDMLIGVELPTSGRIILDGLEISKMSVHHRARLGLGYLPQQPSLIPGLTIEQNLLLALEPTEPAASCRKRLTTELLSVFGITHLGTAWPGRTSGGERRRCEIARAVATRPKYLLLDEPFAGLDPIAISQMRDIVRLIANSGVGVLIADHNVREMVRFVGRVYLIDAGRVLSHRGVAAVVNDLKVRRTYVGDDFSP